MRHHESSARALDVPRVPAHSPRGSALLRVAERLRVAMEEARPADEPSERRYAAERAEALRLELLLLLECHPAWEWLRAFDYLPPELCVGLLARLDGILARSSNPIAFWNACGLNGSYAMRLECPTCELGLGFRKATLVTASHVHPVEGGWCPSLFQLPSRRGTAPGDPEHVYNAVARKCCMQIGTLLRTRPGPFRRLFRLESSRLCAEYPFAPEAAHRRAAQRKVELLFLEELWRAWRQAERLPVPHGFRGVAAAYPTLWST